MSLLIAPSIPEKMCAYTSLQPSSSSLPSSLSQVDRLSSRHRGPQQGVCVCVCVCVCTKGWGGVALMDKHPPPSAPSIAPVTLQFKQKQLLLSELAGCRQQVRKNQTPALDTVCLLHQRRTRFTRKTCNPLWLFGVLRNFVWKQGRLSGSCIAHVLFQSIIFHDVGRGGRPWRCIRHHKPINYVTYRQWHRDG